MCNLVHSSDVRFHEFCCSYRNNREYHVVMQYIMTSFTFLCHYLWQSCIPGSAVLLAAVSELKLYLKK
jgi:hypothetical protein